jgi:hypothetical protein
VFNHKSGIEICLEIVQGDQLRGGKNELYSLGRSQSSHAQSMEPT